jgi:hypothetical protein
MNRPTRTTVIFGLIGGFLLVPTAMAIGTYVPWPLAFKLTLWADLCLYAILLVRWSRRPLVSILFPLAILLGTALWPQTYVGFFFIAAGMLSWIRSGICFQKRPLRALSAEIITVLGGSVMVVIFGGHAPLSWALAVCFFTLFQALYFFIVPLDPGTAESVAPEDPFERAAEEVRRALEKY